MSEYSEKCKYLISKNNSSIYRISKQSGIERTTIQRMVNGSRIPKSKEIVHKFCNVLRVTLLEERELLELYEKERIGIENYTLRQEVINLINSIPKVQQNFKNDILFNSSEDIKKDNYRKTVTLDNEIDIEDAIRYIVKKEVYENDKPHIDIDVWENCKFIMKTILKEKVNFNKSIEVRHFIRFSLNGITGNIDNIKKIENIIPFALTFNENYKVKYSYNYDAESDHYYKLWPHSITTNKNVLLLSHDGKRGLLIEDEDISTQYKRELDIMDNCFRNLLVYDSKKNMTSENVQQDYEVLNKVSESFVFESHMCIIRLLYPELLDEQLENPILKKEIVNFFDEITEKNKKVSFFGQYYIKNFLQSGKLPEIYGKYTRIYTEEERIKMFEYFICNLDNTEMYLLKEEYFPMSKGVYIKTNDINKITFVSADLESSCLSVSIKEKGVCEIFNNFFIELKTSDMVYNKEETKNECKRIINTYLNELNMRQLNC